MKENQQERLRGGRTRRASAPRSRQTRSARSRRLERETLLTAIPQTPPTAAAIQSRGADGGLRDQASFSSDQLPNGTHRSPYRSKNYRAPRRSPQRTIAWESTLVSLVNLLLTAAAIGGAIRLLPVQLAQHHRLQLLEEQVNNMSDRVSRLQDALDRGMDPEQKDALIKERFNKVPPNHLQVRLVPAPVDSSTIASESDQLQQAQVYPSQATGQ